MPGALPARWPSSSSMLSYGSAKSSKSRFVATRPRSASKKLLPKGGAHVLGLGGGGAGGKEAKQRSLPKNHRPPPQTLYVQPRASMLSSSSAGSAPLGSSSTESLSFTGGVLRTPSKPIRRASSYGSLAAPATAPMPRNHRMGAGSEAGGSVGSAGGRGGGRSPWSTPGGKAVPATAPRPSRRSNKYGGVKRSIEGECSVAGGVGGGARGRGWLRRIGLLCTIVTCER